MASNRIITLCSLFIVFNCYGSFSRDLKFPSPVKKWTDDEWDFVEFLKDTQKRVHATIASLTGILDVETDSLHSRSSSASEILQDSIKLTPVPKTIEIENKSLSRAPLRRDLCKILHHMQVMNKTSFSFVPKYRVIKNPQESYILFAYSQILLKNQIYFIKTLFNDGTVMHLDYQNKMWKCAISQDNTCKLDKCRSDMDSSAI